MDTRDQWTANVDVIADIFPSEAELDNMLNDAIPSTPLDSALAILDPLIPWASEYHSREGSYKEGYDGEGFSKYARIVNALLSYLVEDRQAAREHAWALKHALVLAHHAHDTIQMTPSKNSVFADSVSMSSLEKIISRAQQMTAYMCSLASVEAGWSEKVINAILTDWRAEMDPIGKVVYSLIKQSEQKDTIRESRILRDILQHVFKNISKTEADQWMGIVRKLEKRGAFIDVY